MSTSLASQGGDGELPAKQRRREAGRRSPRPPPRPGLLEETNASTNTLPVLSSTELFPSPALSSDSSWVSNESTARSSTARMQDDAGMSSSTIATTDAASTTPEAHLVQLSQALIASEDTLRRTTSDALAARTRAVNLQHAVFSANQRITALEEQMRREQDWARSLERVAQVVEAEARIAEEAKRRAEENLDALRKVAQDHIRQHLVRPREDRFEGQVGSGDDERPATSWQPRQEPSNQGHPPRQGDPPQSTMARTRERTVTPTAVHQGPRSQIQGQVEDFVARRQPARLDAVLSAEQEDVPSPAYAPEETITSRRHPSMQGDVNITEGYVATARPSPLSFPHTPQIGPQPSPQPVSQSPARLSLPPPGTSFSPASLAPLRRVSSTSTRQDQDEGEEQGQERDQERDVQAGRRPALVSPQYCLQSATRPTATDDAQRETASYGCSPMTETGTETETETGTETEEMSNALGLSLALSPSHGPLQQRPLFSSPSSSSSRSRSRSRSPPRMPRRGTVDLPFFSPPRSGSLARAQAQVQVESTAMPPSSPSPPRSGAGPIPTAAAAATTALLTPLTPSTTFSTATSPSPSRSVGMGTSVGTSPASSLSTSTSFSVSGPSSMPTRLPPPTGTGWTLPSRPPLLTPSPRSAGTPTWSTAFGVRSGHDERLGREGGGASSLDVDLFRDEKGEGKGDGEGHGEGKREGEGEGEDPLIPYPFDESVLIPLPNLGAPVGVGTAADRATGTATGTGTSPRRGQRS